MIGLDTSHVIAFTSYINNPKNNTGCRVVAGFPRAVRPTFRRRTESKSLPSSCARSYRLEIVDSIELCEKVDRILLESVDGRPHLAQARPVIAARKPLFIDKPVAASLADVIEVFRLAKENGVPCWSSSSLRLVRTSRALRQRSLG